MRTNLILIPAALIIASCNLSSQYSSSFYDSISSGTEFATFLPGASAPPSGAYVATRFELGSSSDGTLFFETGSGANLTNACTLETCSCRFLWGEFNDSSGTRVTVTRTVQTELTQIRAGTATCALPDVYADEIPNGTGILIDLVRGDVSIGMEPYRFEKGAALVSADFSDRDGKAFRNIKRYVCFETYEKGTKLENRRLPIALESSTVSALQATSFCSADSTGVRTGCEGFSGSRETSTQSHYYSLFITDEVPEIANERYYCTRVYEDLDYAGGSGAPPSSPGLNYYPMDSTFALAATPNEDWSVGVEAPSILSKSGVTQTASTRCFDESAIAPGDSTSISTRCLGYARKPSATGQCAPLDLPGGVRVPTFRLRRFTASTPPSFDSRGRPIEEARGVDVVYVVDRPVDSGDPDAPYSMRGPKPCPTANFDHSGTLKQGLNYTDSLTQGADSRPYVRDLNQNVGSIPSYRGTNRYLRNPAGLDSEAFHPERRHVNWDGTAFPSLDLPGQNSCASTFPSIEYSTSGNPQSLRLWTSWGEDSEVHVRPQAPFTLSYVEDTSFRACAPLSSEFRDPPLHLAVNTRGNVSWCAAAYPTQNPRPRALDRVESGALVGMVKNYTSPVIKNVAPTLSVQSCTRTPPTGGAGWLDSEISAATHPYPASPIAFTGGSIASCASGGDLFTQVGAAHHPNTIVVDTYAGVPQCAQRTCDRTIYPTSSFPARAPLLAEPRDIEHVLIARDDYSCAVTNDGDGLKSSDSRSPAGGCCPRLAGTNMRSYPNFPSDASPVPGNPYTSHIETQATHGVTGSFNCGTPEY